MCVHICVCAHLCACAPPDGGFVDPPSRIDDEKSRVAIDAIDTVYSKVFYAFFFKQFFPYLYKAVRMCAHYKFFRISLIKKKKKNKNRYR